MWKIRHQVLNALKHLSSNGNFPENVKEFPFARRIHAPVRRHQLIAVAIVAKGDPAPCAYTGVKISPTGITR